MQAQGIGRSPDRDGNGEFMPNIKTAYLDASALVKLLVPEDGSRAVRDYFSTHSVFTTTSICFAETLGALKLKFKNQLISTDQYLAACSELMAHIRGHTLEIEDIGISKNYIFDEVECIAKMYELDVSDAYQIVTLRRGAFSTLTGDSRPFLITADQQLAAAARREGHQVWDCLRESAPI
jgi:predicted nucleic acid-binding protein